MKTVLYGRFSPRPNAAECESCDIQLRDLRQDAEHCGDTVIGEFSDPDASGDDEDREGMWGAISAIRKGVVLRVWKAERLARSVFLSEYLHREVEKRGGRIKYLHADTGDTDEGVLVRQVLAAAHEYFKKMNAKHTRFMMLSRQSSGERMSRFAPYGRQFVLEDGEPSKRPTKHHGSCLAEQVIIERIIALKAEGYGSLRIKQQLEALGILCRGKPWHRSTIEKILARASRGH